MYNDQTFRVTNRSTGSHQDLTYGYDPAGNLTSIVDNIQGGTAGRTFTYDPLNRLASASGGFPGSPCNNYGYNAIGNITDKCGIAFQYTIHRSPASVRRHLSERKELHLRS
ncbi:MAG: RHS repeat protein [Deltaproteobacteria bacterium]|nr:RHS repeat protein [Deltaproteobacteria bacterium]